VVLWEKKGKTEEIDTQLNRKDGLVPWSSLVAYSSRAEMQNMLVAVPILV